MAIVYDWQLPHSSVSGVCGVARARGALELRDWDHVFTVWWLNNNVLVTNNNGRAFDAKVQRWRRKLGGYD